MDSRQLRVSETPCPICQEFSERVIADTLIRTLPENERFSGRLKIVECRSCGLRYLNPRPDLRDLGEIYDYDVYEDSTNNNPVLMEHFYQALRRHCPSLHSVLEIGCGTGDYLAWLEAKGLETAGVEFADSASRVKFKGPLYVGRMEDISIPGTFDAVLLLNVIEHLADPVAVLHKIHGLLRPGGVLLMRHPNADLFTLAPYRLMVEWPKYALHRYLRSRGRKTGFTIAGFQSQHLYYFNRRVLTPLLERSGFMVREFSTSDPYNRLRMARAWRRGNAIEGTVAGVRHALGAIGYGPECLWVTQVGRANGEANEVFDPVRT